MNAGKSTALLQSAHNYRERNMRVLLFTAAIDDRYQVGMITSRIGLQEEARVFTPDSDLFAITQQILQSQPIHCVMLDEAHFLTKAQVYQLSEIVDRLNIPVLTYGIRTDFRGELFEGSQYLLAWADNLKEIKTICHCGRKAIMVIRLNAEGKAMREGEQILIGGNETYLSLCRKHFKEELTAS